MTLDVASITRAVLEDLARRLAADPSLSPGGPVPFYFMRRRRYERVML